MGSRLLCCLVLCLLEVGPLDAEVVQDPRHLVKGKGQNAKMDCTAKQGHTALYWYQQKKDKGIQLLFYLLNNQVLEETDTAKGHFSAKCPPGSRCHLEVLSPELGDSALYLCASSQSTAPQASFLSVHKPIMDPIQEAGDGAVSLDAKVTQTPRYLVKEKGQRAEMDCTPKQGHAYVYWYQQNQKQEFKLLMYFQNSELLQETDTAKGRFSAKCPPNLPCTLEIPSCEPGDAALYLCASSQATAFQGSFFPMHKPTAHPTQEAGCVLHRK
ncbi:uncharacterized protein RHO17_008717 [Thomomys bottae]